MRKIIKIRRHLLVGERSDNMLYEFQPTWSSGCRFGTRNARTNRQFFAFEKQKKKLKFSGIRNWYPIIIEVQFLLLGLAWR